MKWRRISYLGVCCRGGALPRSLTYRPVVPDDKVPGPEDHDEEIYIEFSERTTKTRQGDTNVEHDESHKESQASRQDN